MSAFGVVTFTPDGPSQADILRPALSYRDKKNSMLDSKVRQIFLPETDLSKDKISLHLHPADANPNVKLNPNNIKDKFTRATKEAASDLCDILYEYADERNIVDKFIDIKANQTEVCFGSPTSNKVARAIMGYQPIDEANDSQGSLKYNVSSEDLFDFPFRYELNHLRISDYGSRHTKPFRCKRKHNNNEPMIFNWGISTGQGQDDIDLPDVVDGILVTDYLLITCVPNCLDEDAYDQHKIFLIGGTHSEGTKAFKKVMRNEKLLNLMLKLSNQSRAWQVKIKLSDVDRDGSSEIRDFDYDVEYDEVKIRYNSKHDRKAKIYNINSLL